MTIPMIIDPKVHPLMRISLARRTVVNQTNIKLTIEEEEAIDLTVVEEEQIVLTVTPEEP